MANININKTVDDLDQNAPAPAAPWTMPHPPPAPRIDWPTAATRYGFILVVVALGWWQADDQLRWWIPRLLIVLAVAWFVVQRLLVVHIGGVPVWAHRNNLTGLDIVQPMGNAAIEHARRALPSVSSYSPSIQHAPAPKALPSGGDTVNSPEVTVLPNVIAPDSWLNWLTDAMIPHLLLIGKTRSGKSTLADIILAYRARRGDEIAILDLHWSTQDKYGNRKWGGIAPMARNFDELCQVLRQLRREYDDRKRRMQLPASDPNFTPEGCFSWLTIVIDEVPEVVTEFAALSKDDSDKTLWAETVKIFGSGGAKVNMSVILLSQSPNVEDVGINGKMRENLTTIALANMARPFVDRYEPSKARKAQLYQVLSLATRDGMKPAELPAAAEYSGECKVLSRDGIMSYRETVIDADTWQPPARPQARMAVAAKAQPTNTVRASVQVKAPTSGPVFRQERIELYLKKLVLDGKSRADIRAWCEANGLKFDNGKLTKVRSDLGLSEK